MLKKEKRQKRTYVAKMLKRSYGEFAARENVAGTWNVEIAKKENMRQGTSCEEPVNVPSSSTISESENIANYGGEVGCTLDATTQCIEECSSSTSTYDNSEDETKRDDDVEECVYDETSSETGVDNSSSNECSEDESGLHISNSDGERQLDERRQIENEIAKIAIKHNLSYGAVADIAQLLIRLGHDVRKDPRTILKVDTRKPLQMDGHYFGIVNGMKKKMIHGLCNDGKDIILHIGIDGIPLYKDNNVQAWPVMCRLVNGNNNTPYTVSLWVGPQKPKDISAFLEPLVQEISKVHGRRVKYENEKFTVNISAIICDRAARSIVKGIVSHNGKKGCERCETLGISQHRRTFFPKLNAPLRNDQSFREKSDALHHKGDSPFLTTSLDMVKHFPLDPMHLVYLGIVKKFLMILCGHPSQGKTKKSQKCNRGKFMEDQDEVSMEANEFCNMNSLTIEQLQTVNHRLQSYCGQLPSDFKRQGRSLNCLSKWKATECRLFVLYTGPLVLRGILREDLYKHFLYLHSALHILVSPRTTGQDYEYAGKCLRYYVERFGELYGENHLTYNLHSLIHLADECKVHGNLDKFSAFPFENYLGKLKKLLKGNRHTVAELKRKLDLIDKYGISGETFDMTDRFSFSINNLKPSSKRDCYCAIESGLVIKVTDIQNNSVWEEIHHKGL